MNAKVDVKNDGSLDIIKWFVVAALVIGGTITNYLFLAEPLSVRLIGLVLVVCVSALIASQTEKGKSLVAFIKEARIELYKVIWPSRQETLRTTLVVVIVVLVAALFLWMIDWALLHVIGFLTGQ